jgi:hypothetical protein
MILGTGLLFLDLLDTFCLLEKIESILFIIPFFYDCSTNRALNELLDDIKEKQNSALMCPGNHCC